MATVPRPPPRRFTIVVVAVDVDGGVASAVVVVVSVLYVADAIFFVLLLPPISMTPVLSESSLHALPLLSLRRAHSAQLSEYVPERR